MPSIEDVAKRAGVSITTVSRTFRSPGLLSEKTQRRVLEAARELNYQPRAARPGVSRETAVDAIGFQFFADRPDDTLQSNAFYAAMLLGAQEEASSLGFHLIVHTTDRHRLAQELPPMVRAEVIAGMLLVGAGVDAVTLAHFADTVPHIILVDDWDMTGQLESVTSDGFDGAFEATRYLVEQGHRRIGFFLAEENVRPFQERLNGYISGLFHAGIPLDRNLVIGGTFEDRVAEREARLASLFTQPDPPTAFLTANDEYAFLVLRTLRRLGRRVPEDISVIGFDDLPFSAHTEPSLTTVRVDRETMGRLAVQRLVMRIRNPDGRGRLSRTSIRNQVPVSLVIRHSCRRLGE
jgi:DNA-binding LacI/PurR family transcriptional regulator